MLINCPYCGARDHTEFTYGRDAATHRPSADNARQSDWCSYVYDRSNPMGLHVEYWQHTRGCRQWLKVQRDTLNGTIEQVELKGSFASVQWLKVETA